VAQGLRSRAAGPVALAVRSTGPQSADAVVFVHGYGMSASAWAPQFDSRLAERHRLVAFDLRGHGDSERPAEIDGYLDPGVWADDLAQILRPYRARPPIVVAFSFGTAVVNYYVREHGAAGVRGLVFVGGIPGPEQWMPDWAALRSRVRDDEPGALWEMAALLTNDTTGLLREQIHAQLLSTPRHVRSALLRIPSLPPPRFELPVAVFHGADDRFTAPPDRVRLGELGTDVTLRLYNGAGHLLNWDAAEQFNRDLDSYLRRFATAPGDHPSL
jgi:pimeloyl-ACP methyl ester carboxylesterase